jgi:hypothetical protein
MAVRCAEYIKVHYRDILGQKTTPRNQDLPVG